MGNHKLFQVASFHHTRFLWADEAKPAGESEQEVKPEAEASEPVDYEKLLQEKDQQIKEAKDQLLRQVADMQNLRERTKRDAENSRKYAISNFSKDIVDVADTLGMALKAAEKDVSDSNPALKAFHEGIVMTEKTLLSAFEKHGVTKFKSLGEKFNPNVHDGLFEYEDPDQTPGTCGTVVKEGYMIKDKLLRAAQVGTIKKPPAPAAESAP